VDPVARASDAFAGPDLICGRRQRRDPFDSAARGEAGSDSDIDLLVIVDDDTPPEKQSLRAGTKHADLGALPPASFRCARRRSSETATSPAPWPARPITKALWYMVHPRDWLA
jgi:Nucleotidyltransferase domain